MSALSVTTSAKAAVPSIPEVIRLEGQLSPNIVRYTPDTGRDLITAVTRKDYPERTLKAIRALLA